MNKERIQLAVDAMRSGEYVQTSRQLVYVKPETQERSYCCLGVMTDVAIKNGLELTEEVHGVFVGFRDPAKVDTDLDHLEHSILLPVVRDWYGLDSRNPTLKSPFDGGPTQAAHLNDYDGLTLLRIADAFEATYLTEEN